MSKFSTHACESCNQQCDCMNCGWNYTDSSGACNCRKPRHRKCLKNKDIGMATAKSILAEALKIAEKYKNRDIPL